MRVLSAFSAAVGGCSGYISCGSDVGSQAGAAVSSANPAQQPKASATPSAPTQPAPAPAPAPAAAEATGVTRATRTRRQLKLIEGDVPALTARVTDHAGVLDKEARLVLGDQLNLYERRTGHQFAILTVASLHGASAADLGFTVASRTGLGRKGKDDGLLITVAPKDRAIDIQVGYGLEQAIPDELAKRVIREQMAPAFRRRDYANGLRDALKELMRAGEAAP